VTIARTYVQKIRRYYRLELLWFQPSTICLCSYILLVPMTSKLSNSGGLPSRLKPTDADFQEVRDFQKMHFLLELISFVIIMRPDIDIAAWFDLHSNAYTQFNCAMFSTHEVLPCIISEREERKRRQEAKHKWISKVQQFMSPVACMVPVRCRCLNLSRNPALFSKLFKTVFK
jgi:hypothetical protein